MKTFALLGLALLSLGGCKLMQAMEVADAELNDNPQQAQCIDACRPSDLPCIEYCKTAYSDGRPRDTYEAPPHASQPASPATQHSVSHHQSTSTATLTINGETFTGENDGVFGKTCGSTGDSYPQGCPSPYRCHVSNGIGSCVK